jgi:hypothetical protein
LPTAPTLAMVPPEILMSWPLLRLPSATSTTVTSRRMNSPV